MAYGGCLTPSKPCSSWGDGIHRPLKSKNIVHYLMCTMLIDTTIGESVAKKRAHRPRYNRAQRVQRQKARHSYVLHRDPLSLDVYRRVAHEPGGSDSVPARQKKRHRKIISLSESILMARKGGSTMQRPMRLINNTLQDAVRDANILRKEAICRGRKEKRRNLFRIGKAGKGVAGPIKRVINLKSKVRC